MLNAEKYVQDLIHLLKLQFDSRLAYVGLQGSYLREEATENSDIDIMVVIDNMTVADLDIYRQQIISLESYDKSCGFICSTADLKAWNPLEICNVVHSTKDYYGSLKELVPEYTREDVRNFAKMSLNNLYHEICHRYVHADLTKNAAKLPGTYKGVFFILQTVVYLRTGMFVTTKKELLNMVSGRDQAVLEYVVAYPAALPFESAFEELFLWCQETLLSI